MSAPTLLTGVGAAKASGLTYRQVDYLARSGVVVPEVAAEGSGSQRGYGPYELALLMIWRDITRVFGNRAPKHPLMREVCESIGRTSTVELKKGSVSFSVDLAAVLYEASTHFRDRKDAA